MTVQLMKQTNDPDGRSGEAESTTKVKGVSNEVASEWKYRVK